MFRKSLLAIGLLASSISIPAPARAGLVVGNLTSVNNSANSFIGSVQLAAPFTLDASFIPADLESVTLRLTSTDQNTVGVSLWSDSAALPGSELVDLGTANLTSGPFTDFVFTPSTPFTLQPSTSYWVVLDGISGPSTSNVRWRGTDGGHAIDPGSDPAANIAPDLRAFSLNEGATWTSDNEIELLFSVQSVPLPGAALAGLTLLGGVVGIRMRQIHRFAGRVLIRK